MDKASDFIKKFASQRTQNAVFTSEEEGKHTELQRKTKTRVIIKHCETITLINLTESFVVDHTSSVLRVNIKSLICNLFTALKPTPFILFCYVTGFFILCLQEKNPLYQAAKTTFENPTYAGGRQ